MAASLVVVDIYILINIPVSICVFIYIHFLNITFLCKQCNANMFVLRYMLVL